MEDMNDINLGNYTCAQFSKLMGELKPDKRNVVIVWIEGYLSGKSNDTTIDINMLLEKIDEFQQYCSKNPSEQVLAAAGKIFKK